MSKYKGDMETGMEKGKATLKVLSDVPMYLCEMTGAKWHGSPLLRAQMFPLDICNRIRRAHRFLCKIQNLGGPKLFEEKK